jgi:penicillin amidase
MAKLQGNHDSRLGEMFSFALLSSITNAKTLSELDGPLEVHEQRLVDLYNSDSEAFLDAYTRISAWGGRGFQAESGVETFYETPSDNDKLDAVATMIFNAWFSRVLKGVFDDEGLPDVWEPNGTTGKLRAFKRFYVDGRGKKNPAAISSWNEATEESAFFDRLGTDEVERSDEIVLQALADALTFLRSDPTGPAQGGFGSSDMNSWIWGLRHQVTFESLLLDFLPGGSDFAPFVTPFSITTDILPLAENMDKDDPRKELKWFPRHGDQYGVDAGNPGMSGTSFTYGSGPVMRMVIALKDGKVWGKNIIPGGQSALTGSEFFADQAALWLGNKTLPFRFHVEDVVEGAVGRELYKPE